MAVASKLRVEGVTVLVALTAAAHPLHAIRASEAVQCVVDIFALDGENRSISDKMIAPMQTESIAIGDPYKLLISNSVDKRHMLHISIINEDDPNAHVGAFIANAATNPLLIVDHSGEIGKGAELVGFTEIQVYCQQIL